MNTEHSDFCVRELSGKGLKKSPDSGHLKCICFKVLMQYMIFKINPLQIENLSYFKRRV